MQDFFQQHFVAVVVLIALAVALTIFVFRKRKFERHHAFRKGEAVDPQRVKEQNQPDEWSRSH